MSVTFKKAPGTGKTPLAQALGNACSDRLIHARYYKLPEPVDKLRRSMGRATLFSGCLAFRVTGYGLHRYFNLIAFKIRYA